MDAIPITELPILLLSRNFPDLIIPATSAGLLVELWNTGTTVMELQEMYYPGSDGTFMLRLHDILDSLLSLSLPTSNIYDQENALVHYQLKLGTEDTYDFDVVKGGTADNTMDHAAFLKSHFQTWQPQILPIKNNDSHFLTYYAQEAGLKLCATGWGVNSETIELFSLTALKVLSINVSWVLLNYHFSNAPTSIDLWIKDFSGIRLTYIQRLKLTDEYNEFDDQYRFVNSLGGIDNIRFTGELKASEDHTINSALFDDETRDYSLDFNRVFSKNTGHLAGQAQRIWALEFMASPERYHLVNGEWKRITIKKQSAEYVKSQLNNFTFEYSYSLQDNLVNVERILLDPVNIPYDFNRDYNNDFLIL